MTAVLRTNDRPTGRGTALARLALLVGIGCGAAELLAGPTYRAGLLTLGPARQTMRWAATIALGGAAVALLVAGWAGFAGARRARLVALVALAVNLLVAGPPLYHYGQVQRLPHLHDISTDTTNPPRFVAVLPLRAGARNPPDYQPGTAAEQKQGYPDIVPLVLAVPPAQAVERAERAARAMGWEIVAVAPQDGRIEATDTSLLFGFKDDVVIRVAPAAQGSLVDVRSESRVGGSDFGVNAKRVRAYLHRLAAD